MLETDSAETNGVRMAVPLKEKIHLDWFKPPTKPLDDKCPDFKHRAFILHTWKKSSAFKIR